jgi:hypothetical protein
MQEVASLNLLDLGFNDEAWVGIRAERDLIAVCFSLRHHGDIELALRREEWQQLLAPLQQAIAIAKTAERNESEGGLVVKEVVIFQFIDYYSNDEASIFIRVKRDLIEVGLSLKDDERDVQLMLVVKSGSKFWCNFNERSKSPKHPKRNSTCSSKVRLFSRDFQVNQDLNAALELTKLVLLLKFSNSRQAIL